MQDFDGLALLRGATVFTSRSFALLFVCTQPSFLRNTAVVLLAFAVDPPHVVVQFALVPYSTKSAIPAPVGHEPLGVTPGWTRITFPDVPDMLMLVEAKSGVGSAPPVAD